MAEGYHVDLWIAVAAAAPLISVSYTVVIDRALTALYATLAETPLRGQLRNAALQELESLLAFFNVGIIAFLGFVLPGAALWFALRSLANEADYPNVSLYNLAGILVLDLGGLPVSLVLMSLVEWLSRVRARRAQAEK